MGGSVNSGTAGPGITWYRLFTARPTEALNEILMPRARGVDVFTSLNTQHVEGRADTVRQVPGAEIRETVPDRVRDDAVLELVDLPPVELVQRWREGNVYVPDRAGAAERHFFREANLTALRELVLRLVADHVGADTREFRRTLEGPDLWRTGPCLLGGVAPSPHSESLIRWTRRMADALTHRQFLTGVRGAWSADRTRSLRVPIAPPREKLESDLAAPELIVTEAGIRYRLVYQG